MAIITLRVSAGIQGTRAAFQWHRHFKNFFCSRLHYGNKTFEMTAVEWLVQEANLLENNGWILPLIEQALELEKQQIIDAYIEGYSSNLNSGDSEKYYNETYKKPLK
jgi:hypothetical protein